MTRSSILFGLLLSQVALIASCVQGATNSTVSTLEDSIFDSTKETNLGGSILAVVAVLVGGGIAVYGYRYMYETVFATGFALGAVGIAVTAERMLVDKSYWSLGSWLAFIFGGLLCGGLAMWVHPKSNFIAGVAGGIALAVIVTNSAAHYVFPSQTQELFTILCVVFAVVFAAVDLKYGKPVDIVGTSIFGAASLAWGIGFFVGDFPYPNDLEKYATQNVNGDLEYSIPTVWWGYLGGIVVVSVFGVLIQFRKTSRTMINDEFAGFEPHGFGYPIDAVPYVENAKQRPTIPVLDPPASTARDSDYLPTSYPTHESFCRLYSRNTEAQSISKMRSKFLEARAQSVETKTPMDTRGSYQPATMNSSRGVIAEVQEEEF
ncbi:hypothetical protein GN244_ATG03142 [Phytophthora infestans]|uniref:Transmembrane protein 198 n=1 Tax=Phytophthora infestans TaxID=4787 RepID=A0A833X0E6_PHYIN|nr:hypothetical protein GN244_ATG03142 [Phytophthora infestans]KAF4139650.1 hypothetical protein GN958_ATG11135 [Phytophthora infestans]